jgi:hypothetical protein
MEESKLATVSSPVDSENHSREEWDDDCTRLNRSSFRPVTPRVARAQQPGIKRIDLQRHDLSVPGREVVQVIVELEGSLEYEVEGKPPVTLKAGGVLFIPAGTIHSAKNVGSGKGAELATYVVEKGKPLLTLVK